MSFFLVGTGDLLAQIGFMSLACFYLVLGSRLSHTNWFRTRVTSETYIGISETRVIGDLGAGFALTLNLVALLFKLLCWQGAHQMLLIGIPVLIIVVSVTLVKYRWFNGEIYRGAYIRMAIVGVASALLLLLPENAVTEFKYRNYPSYLDALEKANADPTNRQLHQTAEEEREKIYNER